MAFDFIAEQLQAQQQKFRYRSKVCIEKIQAQHIQVDGKAYLNFSSNDYLGLNQHPEINKAYQQASADGICSTGSNLITGYHHAHKQLEDDVCQWLNKEACLLFNSGFAANHGVLTTLGQKNVDLFLDKLSHASLIDGALAAAGTTKRFLHNDLTSLNRLLTKSAGEHKLIVSEGVFSMDGDSAPLVALSNIAQNEKAWLYLDDAHSIGVMGDKGQGSSAFIRPDVVMATLGKAVATSGAFVACSHEVKEYLTNFCRDYIYTTAMSPAIASATSMSIKLIQQENWRREKIAELSELFVSLLDASVSALPSHSSIHAVVIGDDNKTITIANKLKEQGFWLTAIRPPTVPNNTSRLRVTICANHSVKDIKALAENLNKVIK